MDDNLAQAKLGSALARLMLMFILTPYLSVNPICFNWG
jgi:hypothetical protein